MKISEEKWNKIKKYYPVTEIKDRFMFPKRFLPEGEYFCLTANGNGMEYAGIDNGDQLIIRLQEKAEPGDIIVTKERCKEYEPGDEMIGKVVKIIKDIESKRKT